MKRLPKPWPVRRHRHQALELGSTSEVCPRRLGGNQRVSWVAQRQRTCLDKKYTAAIMATQINDISNAEPAA
jgi:hypothetical protein